jgi:vancomycin aglycone glucosyltransferase
MRVFISSIGTRGEVQPIVALAVALRGLGHTAVLCVAPNFKPWIESLGLQCVPVGPDIEQFVRNAPPVGARRRKTPRAQWRPIITQTVREQFRVTAETARGCGAIVVCGGLQAAGRSVAEALRIPYAYAAYCPVTLPSAAHPPPMIVSQRLPRLVNRALWAMSERSWSSLYLDVVNEQRATLGLTPVASVPAHIFTAKPWLAADAALAPAGSSRALEVRQTGAWLLENPEPLPRAVEDFLAAGAPPVYLGLGSMSAAPATNAALIAAARALGRRAILSRGWGGLDVVDGAADCIAIGDVDHAKLLPRVAAVIHHGGAGTTMAAARAGVPQVVVPHLYDQYYFADRVRRLGIGVYGPLAKRLDAAGLTNALRKALRPDVTERARSFAGRVDLRGAATAAQAVASLAAER